MSSGEMFTPSNGRFAVHRKCLIAGRRERGMAACSAVCRWLAAKHSGGWGGSRPPPRARPASPETGGPRDTIAHVVARPT
jgi:hypothetical protein